MFIKVAFEDDLDVKCRLGREYYCRNGLWGIFYKFLTKFLLSPRGDSFKTDEARGKFFNCRMLREPRKSDHISEASR